MLRSKYHVIRVRDNLELTNSQWDVLIPKGGRRGSKRVTDAILRKILDRREELDGRLTDQKIEKINAYLGECGPRKRNEAFNAIDDAISNSG